MPWVNQWAFCLSHSFDLCFVTKSHQIALFMLTQTFALMRMRVKEAVTLRAADVA